MQHAERSRTSQLGSKLFFVEVVVDWRQNRFHVPSLYGFPCEEDFGK